MGRQRGFHTREALREKDAGAGSWESGTVVERASFRELRISVSETLPTLCPAHLCFLQQISLNHMFHSLSLFFFSSSGASDWSTQFQHQISTQFPIGRVFQQENEEGDMSHNVYETPQRLPQASPWAPFPPSLSVCSKKAGSF